MTQPQDRTPTQEQLHNERYDMNTLLSDPQPESIIWKSQMIVKLHTIAQILGMELREILEKP